MGFRKPLQVGRREAARPGGSGDMAHPGTSRASRAAAPADTSLIQALPPIAARMQRLIGLCRVCEQAWEIGFLLVFWLPVHSIRHVPDVQRCWLIPPLFKTYLFCVSNILMIARQCPAREGGAGPWYRGAGTWGTKNIKDRKDITKKAPKSASSNTHAPMCGPSTGRNARVSHSTWLVSSTERKAG